MTDDGYRQAAAALAAAGITGSDAASSLRKLAAALHDEPTWTERVAALRGRTDASLREQFGTDAARAAIVLARSS